MINQFKVKQAFTAQAKVAATALSLEVIELDDQESRPLDKISITPVMLGVKPEPVGLADDSEDAQFAAYQIGVYTPLSKSENLTLSIAESVKGYFTRGTWLEAGGQRHRVRMTDQTNIMKDDKHRKLFLTVYYSVIG